MINYVEKIKELEDRIVFLEKRERRRIIKNRVRIVSKVVVYVFILIFMYRGYMYVNEKYIKPYNEMMDKIKSSKIYNYIVKDE